MTIRCVCEVSARPLATLHLQLEQLDLRAKENLLMLVIWELWLKASLTPHLSRKLVWSQKDPLMRHDTADGID